MNDAYKCLLDKVAKGELELKDPIYDYSMEKNLEPVFDQFYNAMDSHLQDRAKLLGWYPPVLYIVDDPSANALAIPGSSP